MDIKTIEDIIEHGLETGRGLSIFVEGYAHGDDIVGWDEVDKVSQMLMPTGLSTADKDKEDFRISWEGKEPVYFFAVGVNSQDPRILSMEESEKVAKTGREKFHSIIFTTKDLAKPHLKFLTAKVKVEPGGTTCYKYARDTHGGDIYMIEMEGLRRERPEEVEDSK